jgi:hypothetical protein
LRHYHPWVSFRRAIVGDDLMTCEFVPGFQSPATPPLHLESVMAFGCDSRRLETNAMYPENGMADPVASLKGRGRANLVADSNVGFFIYCGCIHCANANSM